MKVDQRSVTAKIFENILFLEEVFGNQADQNIPKIPVLEMAQCFELPDEQRKIRKRPRQREWSLWN